MKDIYTIYEGVLADIETTMKEIDKGAFAKLYPIPTKSDFYYTDTHWKESHCSWGVDWDCKEYIKQIVDEFPDVNNFHICEIDGLTGNALKGHAANIRTVAKLGIIHNRNLL